MSYRGAIDGHVHLTHWTDSFGLDFFNRLDELQANANLEGLCLNALTDDIYGGPEINVMAALYKLHNPTAYAHAGIVYPSVPLVAPFPQGMDTATQYEELMSLGFDGIKILYKPDVQKRLVLPIDHEVFEPLFAAAERDGTHLVWHVADPEIFWQKQDGGAWSYGDGTYPTCEELYQSTLRVLARHPRLCVTFAHFFFWSEKPEELEKLFLQYPNVCVDITPGVEMYESFMRDYDGYKAFFEAYSDRILFGTDSDPTRKRNGEELCSWVSSMVTTDETTRFRGIDFKGLGLSNDAQERIMKENFLRRSGKTPKPIDPQALIAYIEKYLPLIPDTVRRREMLAWVENLAK